ncbi:glycosyltransferase [Methylobacterium sp. J-026]|uniref:glycosyltransferase n=1 Tax=Methylobacterium sp. J-026 TaxID=2836624 RepID=UPI001FB8F077|nr:glycosyltransferase [Methylobacterium sp. J-026]MCJ2134017.1 glycosyltransferase [Methylobacterium sp. J-026]
MNAWDLTADQRAQLLDPDRHLQALSRIAAEALLAGAWETAYVAADRLCRLSVRARARGFLFRAEAVRRLGDAAHARADIEKALELDPTDTLVNLHALRFAEGEARLDAAQALVEDPRTPVDALRIAVAVLQDQQAGIVGRIEADDAGLRGWVTWPAGQRLEGTILGAGSPEHRVVAAEPGHPLAGERYHAAAFACPRPGLGAVEIRLSCDGASPATRRQTFPPRCPPGADPPQPRSPHADDACVLTVIVPVFEDAEATRICLDSLEAQILPGRRWRIIVINDASPNAALVADVARRAAEGRLTLISNGSNRGFAASVNLAASQTRAGDLLLLNADTILPDEALQRLVALAAATPNLGTITPISNNGVITSFPNRHAANDLPSVQELADWDRAARLAAPEPVALPNGIGFCLLVTRACWTAVGGMPLSYGRGYYEDVDLCLKARQLGFQNLCATNLVVGHAGSLSFGAGKRRLVVRNAASLDLRYPDYRAEIEAFRLADPLRVAYAAVERRIAPPPYDVVIVNPLPTVGPALASWLAHWRAAGLRCLWVELDGQACDLRVRLRGSAGGLPQSLGFALGVARERRALVAYLKAVHLDRVVVVAPERCPRVLSALCDRLGVPVDLLVAGARDLAPPAPVPPAQAPAESAPPEAELNGPRDLARLWRRADRLLCGDGMTLARARAALPAPMRRKLVPPAAAAGARPDAGVDRTVAASPDRPASRRLRLGILSPLPSAAVSRLTLAIEARSRQVGAAVQLLVIGGTLHDLGLMAGSATFVTGPIAADEIAESATRFRCAALLLPYRDALFACLEQAACGRRAYFDWSDGAYGREPGDLVLDPAICDTDAAAQIVRWLTAPSNPSS